MGPETIGRDEFLLGWTQQHLEVMTKEELELQFIDRVEELVPTLPSEMGKALQALLSIRPYATDFNWSACKARNEALVLLDLDLSEDSWRKRYELKFMRSW